MDMADFTKNSDRACEVPEWRITAREARQMRANCDKALNRRGQSKDYWIRGRSKKK